jgi:flagellar biosynthesis protein FlhB
MADEQDLDRNETATPYKLKNAKEKGQVAKSADVISALVWTVAVVYLTWQGWEATRTQFRFDQALLLQAAQLDPHGAGLWPLISHMLRNTLALLLPFFLALMLTAIIANVVQTGPVLSAEPIKADFTRLNPINGLKKVFSMRTLFDAARACIKLVLLIAVSYHALKGLAPQFYSLANLSPVGYLRTLLSDIATLGLELALVLGLIAAIDWMYTRHEFAKKMRMSRRELKDETKNREGDPRIRARLRELRREALKRTLSLRRTKNADVLLTNPTHVAVALRYQHGEMASPQLIAKGAGQAAAVMRQIAAKHRIPIVQNPALARALFSEIQVDQHVPQNLYAEVARIVVWVFAMRELQQRNNPIRGAHATGAVA